MKYLSTNNTIMKFHHTTSRSPYQSPFLKLSDIRFHDFRHTSFALMLNNRVDILVASKRLGHARPSITLDVYWHLLISVQNEVAEKMNNPNKRKEI